MARNVNSTQRRRERREKRREEQRTERHKREGWKERGNRAAAVQPISGFLCASLCVLCVSALNPWPRMLRDLLEATGGLHGVVGGGDHTGGEPEGVGKFGFGRDAEEVVHGADQIDRVDGAVLDLFAASVGSAHHVPAPETAAGHQRREDLSVMAAAAIPRG